MSPRAIPASTSSRISSVPGSGRRSGREGGKSAVAWPSTCSLREQAQRLCCVSSALPWPLVTQDCVEHGEELAHAGDHGDHLGLAGGDEALAEGTDGRVVTHGSHRGEEEDGANAAASATNE